MYFPKLEYDYKVTISDMQGNVIAEIQECCNHKHGVLFAEAPALLEAAQSVIDTICMDHHGHSEVKKLKAVINRIRYAYDEYVNDNR